jgi:hypothetical protein
VLDRHGLVEHARARRPRAAGTALSQPAAPNDLWCCDFKGEFRLGNGRLCYPLTVTDQASRFILMVEALEGTAEAPVFTAFHRLFQERGLPGAIRSDNGVPFALHGRAIGISSVFAGQRLGLREVDTDVWLVSFMHYDLGYIDLEARTPQSIDTPFGSRVSPM